MKTWLMPAVCCSLALGLIAFTADCDFNGGFSCSLDGCATGSGADPGPTPPPKQISSVAPDESDFNNQTIGQTFNCSISTTSHLGNWIRGRADYRGHSFSGVASAWLVSYAASVFASVIDWYPLIRRQLPERR